MRGRPKKYGEHTVNLCIRVPISLKRDLETLFPGRISEFAIKAIEDALARYSESYYDQLLREKEEHLKRIREIDEILSKAKTAEVSDKEKIWLIENANHIVKAITSSNGNWRAEIPPEEALKLVLNSFCERFGVSFPEAKRKLLAVFPELPEEVVS